MATVILEHLRVTRLAVYFDESKEAGEGESDHHKIHSRVKEMPGSHVDLTQNRQGNFRQPESSQRLQNLLDNPNA